MEGSLHCMGTTPFQTQPLKLLCTGNIWKGKGVVVVTQTLCTQLGSQVCSLTDRLKQPI